MNENEIPEIQSARTVSELKRLPADEMTWDELNILHNAERMELLNAVASGKLSPQEAQALVTLPLGDFEIVYEPDPEIFALPEENERVP
ncbi:unnamed protein product [uncultured bacterium]|nr:unnamed protein product [uncultured bacterium]